MNIPANIFPADFSAYRILIGDWTPVDLTYKVSGDISYDTFLKIRKDIIVNGLWAIEPARQWTCCSSFFSDEHYERQLVFYFSNKETALLFKLRVG